MVEPRLARAYGTLAGFGFIGGALLLLPSTRLLDPTPAPEAYLLTLLALVTGLVCLAVPWDLLDPRWLHLIGVAAVAEAAATVAVFGPPYVALFFLIGVLVAYVAPDSRTLAAQLALIAVALFGPVFYGPEDARSSLNLALVTAPVLLLTTCVFSYLRLKMVHDRRAYHRFAEQTLVLSSQIAGRPLGPLGAVSQPEPMPRLSGVRPPASALAAFAALLGIPLLTGGLATAGVKLPDAAQAPFEGVGIELPNQGDGSAGNEGSEPNRRAGARVGVLTARAGSGSEPADSKKSAGSSGGGNGSEADGDGAPPTGPNATQTATAPESPATSAPAASAPESPSGGGSGGDGGDGAGSGPTPLQDLLDEATGGLKSLLDQLKSAGKK